MKFNKNGGFTLVELIVVIAILAILAGVAVPVYSGYIKKAEEAADQQLLGAVNTAFAAASLQNGEDVNEITNATITVNADGTIGAITGVWVNGTAADAAKYNEAFATYFAGNESTAFKVIKGLKFDYGKHSFVDSNTPMVTVQYNGSTVSISTEAVEALKNSTFGTTIGADKLLGQVADVSNLAYQSILGNDEGVLGSIVLSDAYAQNLADSLGMTKEELDAYLTAQGDDAAKFLANSLVLSTAQNTTGMTAADVTNKLTSDTFVSELGTKLNNEATAQEGLADAALAYGLYTSYMYANGKGDQIGDINDFTSLKGALDVMKTDDFKDYLANEGQADVDAYLSAMEVISGTTESPDALNSALTNGFTDPELVELMDSLMK